MGMCILCSVFLALSKCHFTFKAQNIVCSVSLVWFGLVFIWHVLFVCILFYVYVDIFLFFSAFLPFSSFSLNSFAHFTPVTALSLCLSSLTPVCLRRTNTESCTFFSGKVLLIFWVLAFARNALNNYNICNLHTSNNDNDVDNARLL